MTAMTLDDRTERRPPRGASARQPYDGVVVCAPVTVPYRRYSVDSAQWWIGRALHDLTKRAGLTPRDIDGLSISSFTLGSDSAIGLTQHFGLSPRWLDSVPLGGASGVVALRRAARAVQAGDADIVACVAGDTNHVDSFRHTLANFSRFAQDAVYPYGAGGANASFALIAKNYMNTYGARREDFGKLCVAQRDNALTFPHALMKKPLTLEAYMAARPIADPIHLFDCVMPCAGAEAFLVCREDTARRLGLAGVRVLATIERHNAFPDDPVQIRGGWAMDIDDLWGYGRRRTRRRRFRRDLRRLSGDLDDAVRGLRLSAARARGRTSCAATASPITAIFRTTPPAASCRWGRRARPAAISVWSKPSGN